MLPESADQLGAVQMGMEIGKHPASARHLQHHSAELLLARGALGSGGSAFEAA